MYTIYDVHLNSNTKDYNGLAWIIDGELGRWSYPGTCSREDCERLYMRGKSFESASADCEKNTQKAGRR